MRSPYGDIGLGFDPLDLALVPVSLAAAVLCDVREAGGKETGMSAGSNVTAAGAWITGDAGSGVAVGLRVTPRDMRGGCSGLGIREVPTIRV